MMLYLSNAPLNTNKNAQIQSIYKYPITIQLHSPWLH